MARRNEDRTPPAGGAPIPEAEMDLDQATVVDPTLQERVLAAIDGLNESPEVSKRPNFVEDDLPSAVRRKVDRPMPASQAALNPAPPSNAIRPAAIDLAEALGVRPDAPPPTREPRPALETSFAEAVEHRRSTPLPRLGAPPRHRERAETSSLGVERLWNLARTSDSIARLIPYGIASFVLLATAVVFAAIFAGKPGPTPHVELAFLSLPGQTSPQLDPDAKTRVRVETQPPGVVVLFGAQIIGRTPCEAELPVRLADAVGVRLRGPYFEEWLNEIERTPAGEFRIQAALETK